MKVPPRVSVALCTYDGAAFILEQLRSIVEQSRPPDEVVVFDDRSNDDTAQLATDFASTSPVPVSVFINADRRGPTRNFERAAAAATGDILFFSDQDDRWHPNKVARVLEDFEDDRTLCAISDASLVDGHGTPLGVTLWQRLGFGGRTGVMSDEDVRDWLLRRTIAFGTVMAIRASLREFASPIELPAGHDNWTALVAAGLGRVRLIAEPLISYRQHAAQVSSASRPSWSSRIKRPHQEPDALLLRPTARTFRALARRLRTHAAASPDPNKARGLARALDSKADHVDVRGALSATPSTRLRQVVGELTRMRYHHYSNGFPSAARDLVWGTPEPVGEL